MGHRTHKNVAVHTAVSENFRYVSVVPKGVNVVANFCSGAKLFFEITLTVKGVTGKAFP